jgi:parallel beta-helix repeat protein
MRKFQNYFFCKVNGYSEIVRFQLIEHILWRKKAKRKEKLIMNKKHFYAAVILLLFLAVGIQPAFATILLTSLGWDDGSGNDPEVGKWDQVTKTGTLTKNVSQMIQIVNNGIILDGDGFTITGLDTGDGVFVQDKEYITIKNLNVQNFATGIHLASCQNSTLIGNTASGNNIGILLATGTTGISMNNTLIGNTASNNDYGIRLYSSRYDTLTNNTAEWNAQYGIELSGSYNYTLTGNTVSNNIIGFFLWGCSTIEDGLCTLSDNFATNNSTGIQLQSSSSNTVTGNTVSNNNWGIRIRAYDGEISIGNKVYNNNFDNTPGQQADVVKDGTGNIDGNVFNLAWPTGGNYWSDLTGPDENGDGFVDTPPAPYIFTGGKDNLPLAVWPPPPPTPEGAILNLIDTVEAMNLQQGIDNSLDAKLDAAANALDDVNQNNDVAAINSLNAFKNAVETQRGDKITNEQADTLIGKANYIIALLSG